MMRRIVVLVVLVLGLIPVQAQSTQEIFTPSGRFSLEIPASWVGREYAEEEEIRGLDSETLVMATSFDVIDQYLAREQFDGTVIFLSAYPYHVFEEAVLGKADEMLADVTVFDLLDLRPKTVAGFPAAEFFYSEQDQFFVSEQLFDTGELAYRATVYSTRFDEYDLVENILDSGAIHPISLDQVLKLDEPIRTITHSDGRLSFQIPEAWLYWYEGDTSMSFGTSGAAYETISYSFMPSANPEVVFAVQRLVVSGLRPEEVKNGQADLNALMARLQTENNGLRKDTPFVMGEMGGQAMFEGTWLVQGEKETVRTQTRLFDAGDSVYVIQAQFSPSNPAIPPMVDQILGSMTYQAPNELIGGEGLEIGNTAPNFSLNTLEGEEVSLAQYQGKVVFVNMWATWCGPCHREAPAMQALYQAYDGQFEILAVNIAETPREVQGFVDEYQLTFPVLLDSVERVAQNYGLRAYPTTYILSREGVIMEKIEGSFSEQGLQDLLAIYVGRVER